MRNFALANNISIRLPLTRDGISLGLLGIFNNLSKIPMAAQAPALLFIAPNLTRGWLGADLPRHLELRILRRVLLALRMPVSVLAIWFMAPAMSSPSFLDDGNELVHLGLQVLFLISCLENPARSG